MAPASDEAEAYQYIIDLVYRRCRVRLHEGKHSLIRSRLGKRLRALGLGSLAEYCARLQTPEGGAEIVHAVDALTTNFTHFLREPDHFEFLMKQVAATSARQNGEPYRVWSAACATGEEAYSIAFCLAQALGPGSSRGWRVLATDVSTRALTHAHRGVYAADRVEPIPPAWLQAYFQRGVGEWEGYYRVQPSLAEQIEFRQLNLLEGFSFQHRFSTIFCRNVMIYFDRETQQELVNRLSRCLRPGGYLLVGHSESLSGLENPLRCLRPSIYQQPD